MHRIIKIFLFVFVLVVAISLFFWKQDSDRKVEMNNLRPQVDSFVLENRTLLSQVFNADNSVSFSWRVEQKVLDEIKLSKKNLPGKVNFIRLGKNNSVDILGLNGGGGSETTISGYTDVTLLDIVDLLQGKKTGPDYWISDAFDSHKIRYVFPYVENGKVLGGIEIITGSSCHLCIKL